MIKIHSNPILCLPIWRLYGLMADYSMTFREQLKDLWKDSIDYWIYLLELNSM
jgi:hypothetical protein